MPEGFLNDLHVLARLHQRDGGVPVACSLITGRLSRRD